MTDTGKDISPSKFNIENELSKFDRHTHTDDSGQIEPQYIGAEIKTKINILGTTLYIWEKKGAGSEERNQLFERSIQKINGIFPGKEGVIKEEFRENAEKEGEGTDSHLRQYLPLIEEPRSPTENI